MSVAGSRPLRPLYLKIYVAFLAVGALAISLSAVVSALLFGRPATEIALAAEIGISASALPPPDDPSFPEAFRALQSAESSDIALFDPQGEYIIGDDIPMGEIGLFRHRTRIGMRIRLPDGSTIAVLREPDVGRRLQLLASLSVVATLIAIGCLPIARGITHRLEALQAGMSSWGQGELDVRIALGGQDEVAAVARTFNDAADRVQQLFDAQQRVLASVSHDLRTPLTRLRMALELLSDGAPPAQIIPDAISDIEELDATVGDILQVARMAVDARPRHPVQVALGALARSEAARVGATVTGPDRNIRGDARLLQRMLRNLLENAVRHGAPPIEVVIGATSIEVRDRGPGVQEIFREQIFEPFFRLPSHAEGRDGSVGLGLHLVRQIARFHGGDVHVFDREEGGSRFIVDLPDTL